MPAPSLYSLATKATIRNRRNLEHVGRCEYEHIKPALARIEDPEQLHRIELNSPHIAGEDAELWKAFIARDITDWKKKNYEPKNPKKWYDIYKKYVREEKQEIEMHKEALRVSMAGLKKHKEAHVSKKVDARYLPKLPRDPRMLANNGGVPIGGRNKGPGRTENMSTLSFSGGSKTKMTSGAGVIMRAKREAKEIAAMNKLRAPNHTFASAATQITRAPQAMLDAARRAGVPAVKIAAPRMRTEVINQFGTSGGLSMEERERRLRALTMPKNQDQKKDSTAAKPTMISDQELSDEELFADHKPTQTSQNRPRKVFGTKLGAPQIHSEVIRAKAPVKTSPRPSNSGQKSSRDVGGAKRKLQDEDEISEIEDLFGDTATADSKTKTSFSQSQALRATPRNSSPYSPSGQGTGITSTSNSKAGNAPNSQQSPPLRPIIRKRAVVDIFNRGGNATGVKKQRIL